MDDPREYVQALEMDLVAQHIRVLITTSPDRCGNTTTSPEQRAN
jgi:hypothetical protein